VTVPVSYVYFLIASQIDWKPEEKMDTVIKGVIAMHDKDGGIAEPDAAEMEHLRAVLEKAGFEIVYIGCFGISVSTSRETVKTVLGLELPDPPYGSHQHLSPTTEGLKPLSLILEIYPPINHDI
jgi:hypothetical protein